MECPYCGVESNDPSDFTEVPDKLGWWCECCDAFIPKESQKHRFIMLLEKKSFSDQCLDTYELNRSENGGFQKRLSPLRYPGGKSKVIETIYRVASNNGKMSIDKWVEPFCGGASVGLSLLEAKKCQHLVLNDLDYGIISLFRVILDDPDSLKEKILKAVPNKDEYFMQQQKIKSHYDDLTPLDAAFAILYVNRLSFSGIVKANPQPNFERWCPNTLCKRIDKIHAMRNAITVENKNAVDIIEEFYWSKENVLFIDPPYYKKGKSLYTHYYDDEQHLELICLMESLYHGMPGATLVATYDDVENIREMLRSPVFFEPQIIEWPRVYSIISK